MGLFPIRFRPSHCLYDLIRPYAWPTRGVPFDGLVGKGNQLRKAQTVLRASLSSTIHDLDYDLRLTEKCS